MESVEKERILVMGVSNVTCDALFGCLKGEYDIDIAPSFEAAIDMIGNNSYNVVVAGIDAPGMSGVEVLHKFKKTKSEVPIVVITTHNSVPLAVEAMKAGAYDYITTPFNLDELKIIIFHASAWRKMVEEVKEKRIFQEMALLDGLTHIYNRRYFDELIRRESGTAVRYKHKFSLLLIDVDDFKKYNDTYGHQAGDEALRVVANCLVHETRSTDFVARYGGEEFAVITPHTDKQYVSFMAARITRYVANKAIIVNGSVKTNVSISVGVATFGEDTLERDELVKLADQALYDAKKYGKNRVCIFGVPPTDAP